MDNGNWGYELTILLASAFRLAVDELHKELGQLGFEDVRPTHGFIFQKLSQSSATGKQLAEHMGVTKQAMSITIDYLEEHGYVHRQPHPTDQRGKIIVLSERAWACIHATEAIFTNIENRWYDVLGEERIATLRSDLRQLMHTFPDAQSFTFRPVW